ncbi:MAG: Trm112 family protein [Terracidiphilus sp.]
MPAQPPMPERFDTNVLSQLACPACHGELHLEGARLICGGCRRAYPIVDGIPVLIAERAESAADPS